MDDPGDFSCGNCTLMFSLAIGLRYSPCASNSSTASDVSAHTPIDVILTAVNINNGETIFTFIIIIKSFVFIYSQTHEEYVTKIGSSTFWRVPTASRRRRAECVDVDQ